MFTESPFYKILEPLSSTVECKGLFVVAEGCTKWLVTDNSVSPRTNERHRRLEVHPELFSGRETAERPQSACHGLLCCR